MSHHLFLRCSVPPLALANAKPFLSIRAMLGYSQAITTKVRILYFLDGNFIDCFTIVPIFDGRVVKFELNDALTGLEDILPLYQSEIPHGSFALVAYTANSYYRGRASQRQP